MVGYKPRFTRPQTVTHPSTHRARRRVTSLIETTALPLSQAATPGHGLHPLCSTVLLLVLFSFFCVTVPCGRYSFPPINFVVHIKRIILLHCTVNNIIHRIKIVVTKIHESSIVLKPITNTVTLTRNALDIFKIWD